MSRIIPGNEKPGAEAPGCFSNAYWIRVASALEHQDTVLGGVDQVMSYASPSSAPDRCTCRSLHYQVECVLRQDLGREAPHDPLDQRGDGIVLRVFAQDDPAPEPGFGVVSCIGIHGMLKIAHDEGVVVVHVVDQGLVGTHDSVFQAGEYPGVLAHRSAPTSFPRRWTWPSPVTP